MSLEDLVLSEISWGREERNTRSRLCMASKTTRKQRVEPQFPRAGGRGNGELLLRGHRAEVLLAVKSGKLVSRVSLAKACWQRVNSYA